jgi:hypothetical protein
MSEESPIQMLQRMDVDEEEEEGGNDEEVLRQFQLRRTWESRYTSYTKQPQLFKEFICIFITGRQKAYVAY